MIHLGVVVSQNEGLPPPQGCLLPGAGNRGSGLRSRQPRARGRGQRPPSGLGKEPKSAPWLRGQQPRKGPEAGPGEHHFWGGVGVGREVPYRRSQEGPPAQGREPEGAGCSEKDLRQAQGLRAPAGGLRRLKKGEPGGSQGSKARGAVPTP